MTQPENTPPDDGRGRFLDRQVQKLLAATDVIYYINPETGERRDERRTLQEVLEHETIAASRTPDGAQSRAAELIATATATGSDAPFWATPAENILAACLYAAATDGSTLDDVRAWLTSPERVITEVLARIGDTPEAVEMTALQRWADSNAATAAAVIATARTALGPAINPPATDGEPTTPRENQ